MKKIDILIIPVLIVLAFAIIGLRNEVMNLRAQFFEAQFKAVITQINIPENVAYHLRIEPVKRGENETDTQLED